MRTIRTTNEPHRERQVDDLEYLDLSRQNLIVPEPDKTPTATTDQPAASPPAPKPAAK